MSKRADQNPLEIKAWWKPGLHRDGERLARALKHLPVEERKVLRELLRKVYEFAESVPGDSSETGRNGYELSLELEAAWLRISSVGHARDTWLREGRLFSIYLWQGPRQFREIDPGWLASLTVDREEFQLAPERRCLWFHARAQERVGAPRTSAVREYDPTETPSYEYVWDD